MPTEMECVIKGTIVQNRRWRREYITEAISGVAGVTRRVMPYRSLMTGCSLGAHTESACVCESVCVCVCVCACMRMYASLFICRL